MLHITPSPRVVHERSIAARAFFRWLGRRIGALSPEQWGARIRGRRWLAAMDERSLRDMGLSRNDIWEEIGKPFWRG